MESEAEISRDNHKTCPSNFQNQSERQTHGEHNIKFKNKDGISSPNPAFQRQTRRPLALNCENLKHPFSLSGPISQLQPGRTLEACKTCPRPLCWSRDSSPGCSASGFWYMVVWAMRWLLPSVTVLLGQVCGQALSPPCRAPSYFLAASGLSSAGKRLPKNVQREELVTEIHCRRYTTLVFLGSARPGWRRGTSHDFPWLQR